MKAKTGHLSNPWWTVELPELPLKLKLSSSLSGHDKQSILSVTHPHKMTKNHCVKSTVSIMHKIFHHYNQAQIGRLDTHIKVITMAFKHVKENQKLLVCNS